VQIDPFRQPSRHLRANRSFAQQARNK
jgi:hypothetical protein